MPWDSEEDVAACEPGFSSADDVVGRAWGIRRCGNTSSKMFRDSVDVPMMSSKLNWDSKAVPMTSSKMHWDSEEVPKTSFTMHWDPVNMPVPIG
ncbi:unnamed protein product [Heligmosomoides polygyrus]|uniref:Uncharacterized protein n=1 Tax=Heligmosomoides polygyrus TaxID=6339 RepID=A0A183GJE5_HELPZ|nr:unnamed protein product [Heligmosomoides polygyrus]